jgi:hypothetical protein
MPSLYEIYKGQERWEKDLAADLLPAIEHLRKIFGDNHWSYGHITQKLCYWILHPGTPHEEVADYIKPFDQIKAIVGAEGRKSFLEIFDKKTAPAYFKSYFDIYLNALIAMTLSLFMQFVAIGKANEQRLGTSHLKWAEEQTKNMIRSKMHTIEIWIRDVCDVRVYDPEEDHEELIFWRKWQAPMLLMMKPARHWPYDPNRSWERMDAKDSRGLLEAFAVDYVLRIEGSVEKLAGILAVELAKQPKPSPQPISTSTAKVPLSPEKIVASGQPDPKPASARQEVRKLNTQEKYQDWKRAYRSLKQTHPNRTDIWFSEKIAEMDIAKEASPETIRKHMK